jgi:hypothetical protein
MTDGVITASPRSPVVKASLVACADLQANRIVNNQCLVCRAAAQAAACTLLATAPSWGDQAAPCVTITDLPALALSCIVQHIRQGDRPREERQGDVAALRSVCRWLRSAVDPVVTHARIHVSVGLSELCTITRRFTGIYVVVWPITP